MKRIVPFLLVIWLAQWTTNYSVKVPCPDNTVTDPYTGEFAGLVISTTTCTKDKSHPMTKTFDTQQAALDFQAGCPVSECTGWNIFQPGQ